MRNGLILALGLVVAVALTGCGVFDDDGAGASNATFGGQVTVGLTDNVPASGTYVLQNIYNPNVREILAIVQIENVKEGTEVIGRWYQMGVIQQRAPNITAEGALISEAGFEVSKDSINTENRGGGRLSLRPNAPLPEDSYMLKVYVDGKLAKTQPFVISRLVPGPAGTGTQQTPAATSTPTR
jgi:hypothetical protein